MPFTLFESPCNLELKGGFERVPVELGQKGLSPRGFSDTLNSLYSCEGNSVNFRFMKSAGLFATAALGIMLMGGCASRGHSSVADSGSKQVCTYDSGFGSHVGIRHCTSGSQHKAKQKAEHKQAQQNADVGAGVGTGGGRL